MKRLEARLMRLEAQRPEPSLPIMLDLSALGAEQATRITEAEDLTALPSADLLAILNAQRRAADD